jgi:hypothetical protein
MLPGDFTVSEGHGHPLVVRKYKPLLKICATNASVNFFAAILVRRV